MPETKARVTRSPGQPCCVRTGTYSHWLWSEAHIGSLGHLHYKSQGAPSQELLGRGDLGQEQSLTSLNSWIWVCSKLEKTLDDALWARRPPPSFFLVFLLA